MFKNKQPDRWFNEKDFTEFKKSGFDFSIESWQMYFTDMGYTHIRLDMQKEVIKHIMSL